MVYLDEETAALSLPIVKLNVSCSWKEFEVVTREVQLGPRSGPLQLHETDFIVRQPAPLAAQ